MRTRSSVTAATADTPRSVGRLLAITGGVSVVGLVGGAFLAAPDQMLPMAQALRDAIALNAGPTMDRAVDTARALVASGVAFVGEASPRTLAMLVAGSLAALLGTAAGWAAWRNRRPRIADTSRAQPVVSALQVSHRRSSARPTPKQVQALAAQGASVLDIARGTGLPVDAVSMLLAVAKPARQVPHGAA